VLRRHRADDDVAAVGTNAFEVADVAEIDEMLRRRQPQLHHGDQAVAPGQGASSIGEEGRPPLTDSDGDSRIPGIWASSAARGGIATPAAFPVAGGQKAPARMRQQPTSSVSMKAQRPAI
jgi:hypothetical protein